MKIYRNQTVWDAALERIRWLFDEFPNVVVGVSGGKDSTIVFNLAMMVAREKDRLPLTVLFVDQEAEWKATIEQIKLVMNNPDVKPLWFQMPIRIFNATSTSEHWLCCWDPEKEDVWMREKDPIAIHDNRYGTDRFHKLFPAIFRDIYKDEPAAYIAGIRTEESPLRHVALTRGLTYKGATWGKVLDKKRQHFTFYPIYDWSYTDVWKAIHDHGWPYNRIYDIQFMHGEALKDMRVSNLHHETAVHSLFYLQEAEPDTYERLTQRLSGVDMAGKLNTSDFFVTDLPFMFADWKEYRDYLLETLIENEEWKAGFKEVFAWQEDVWGSYGDKLYKMHINSILTNDWEHIKLVNFERNPGNYALKKAWLAEHGDRKPKKRVKA